MAGLNRLTLIGNLGDRVDLQHTQSGRAVASFSMATTERWKDSQGEVKERTDWHRVTVWGPMAKNCREYLSKGSKVYVEGRLQYEKYQDKKFPEVTHYAAKVVADSVIFLDRKRASQPGEDPGRPVRGGDATPDDFENGYGESLADAEPPPEAHA